MEDFFYDRDKNLSGIANIGSLKLPNNGYTVNFKSENTFLYLDNNYFKINNYTLNSVKTSVNCSWLENEDQALKFVNYIETKNSDNLLNVNIDPSIYKRFSIYSDGYSLNHLRNGLYDIKTSFSDFNVCNDLNWSGSKTLNMDIENWESSKDYSKNDVIYSGINDLKINNYYYCTGDHSSLESNSPTGENSFWTQDFFWDPDQNSSNSVQYSPSLIGSKYKQRNKTKNNSSLLDIKYTFSNISTKQTKSMLHFLEKKSAYRRFVHRIPSFYNRPKVFLCTEWSHNYVYQDCHNFSVVFKEDPLGSL